MELRQLRYLVALDDERHFTRAAARLHIAQPALSQQIKRLEDEVGLALVDRTTRHVALTPAGELLVGRARRALSEIDAAAAELADLAGIRTGRVVRSTSATPTSSSSRRTCWESAGWAMCSRAAARVKWRSSASATR